MLTRKDYVAVARLIAELPTVEVSRRHNPEPLLEPHIAKYQLVAHFADYCEADNPNFDRDRFFKACYLKDA